MKLIGKDALVVKLVGRLNKYKKEYNEMARYEIWETAKELEHKINELEKTVNLINTIEMKEVDFEKEISNYLYSHLGRPRMELELDWTQCDISCKADKLVAFAQHFFELGLKAQK